MKRADANENCAKKILKTIATLAKHAEHGEFDADKIRIPPSSAKTGTPNLKSAPKSAAPTPPPFVPDKLAEGHWNGKVVSRQEFVSYAPNVQSGESVVVGVYQSFPDEFVSCVNQASRKRFGLLCMHDACRQAA